MSHWETIDYKANGCGFKSARSIPSFRRAVGVKVVNGCKLQVVDGSVAVKAIALTRTVIAKAVSVAFIQRITP